ncbi:hypothetical protein GGI35DRAFT_455201, partial [Trichoderma velutinum]
MKREISLGRCAHPSEPGPTADFLVGPGAVIGRVAMRACRCRGTVAREQTLLPSSGSCLELCCLVHALLVSLSCLASRNSSESIGHHWMGFTKYGYECVVGETCIMLVRVPFFFLSSHT